jgi:hypothetical protein
VIHCFTLTIGVTYGDAAMQEVDPYGLASMANNGDQPNPPTSAHTMTSHALEHDVALSERARGSG